MKKQAILLVCGLVFLEWLDFSLYLYLAKTVFASQFFPASSASLTLTFGLFTVAYFARPLGGWFFGRDADASGRRNPMVYSAALMGFATLGICILPGYAQIGVYATWGLLLLRALQGLALGGEVNISGLFMVEHHPHKPLVAGSMVAASGAAGMFIGGVLATLLQYDVFADAWRLIFALTGGLSLWVCRLRKQLRESPEFKKNREQNKIRWFLHGPGLLNIAFCAIFVSVTVYMCNVFWVSRAIDEALWSKAQCAWTGAIVQLASALLALFIARLANTSQVYRLMRTSMFIIAIAAPALFYCTTEHNVAGVLLALVGYVIANALICASLYYFLYLQLPAAFRCQGVSVVWALAASVGTISLPLSQWAIVSHYLWFPGALVSTVALATMLLCRKGYSAAYDSIN